MKTYIASDHTGFDLKEKVKKHFNLIDLGPKKFQKTDDYPDYAKKLANKVAKTKTQGIL